MIITPGNNIYDNFAELSSFPVIVKNVRDYERLGRDNNIFHILLFLLSFDDKASIDFDQNSRTVYILRMKVFPPVS